MASPRVTTASGAWLEEMERNADTGEDTALTGEDAGSEQNRPLYGRQKPRPAVGFSVLGDCRPDPQAVALRSAARPSGCPRQATGVSPRPAPRVSARARPDPRWWSGRRGRVLQPAPAAPAAG